MSLTQSTDSLIPMTRRHFVEVNLRYYADYVGFAQAYYRKRSFPMFQIVWPNAEGHYPREEGAHQRLKEWQPVLGK